MSNILGRFRKRNIQTNFYHFALVVFVVAISVCLISGLFINYFTLKSSVDRFFTQSKLPNLWIGTNQITKDDEDFFASKFDYGKRYKFETNYNVGSKEFEGEFFVSDGKITIPYIMEGERERGCYVDAKFAELNNFGLNYSVVSFNYELGGEKKELEFKVVGFISFAEYLSADGESMIFIDEDVFLDEMKSEFAGIYDADLSIIDYNEILISSEVSERDIQDIQSYYDLSDSKIISVTKRADIESVIAINNELEIAKKMLWIFPIIFVLISILVICSAISQFVLKERYNIGMLKSLGISNNRILSNYCGYGVVICFIGACFGLMIAPLIIPNMTFAVYDKLYNLPRDLVKLNCPVWFVVLIILYAVIVGCFTSLFVTINLVKKTPKECMSRFLKTNLKSRKKKRKLPVIFGSCWWFAFDSFGFWC